MRARIGKALRRWADQIDHEGAPRAVGWSFTIEQGRGAVFREGRQQGCPLWYIGAADYDRAHDEADSAAEGETLDMSGRQRPGWWPDCVPARHAQVKHAIPQDRVVFGPETAADDPCPKHETSGGFCRAWGVKPGLERAGKHPTTAPRPLQEVPFLAGSRRVQAAPHASRTAPTAG